MENNSRKEEVFVDINGYEGKYQISNHGNVWSVVSQRLLKGTPHNMGYWCYKLQQTNGKAKLELAHRLVALHFCDKPDGKTVVNHKDCDKHNNYFENLEWITSKANNEYSYATGTRSKNTKPIQVNQYDKDGNYIATYPSMAAAARAIGKTPQSIQNILYGKTNTSGGYVWKRADEAEVCSNESVN